MATKNDYINTVRNRYKKTKTKKEKSKIINEVEANLNLKRKHIIKILNGKYHHTKYKKARHRKPKYPYHLNVPLSQIWKIAGKPCSKNLKPQIKDLIDQLEKFNEINLNQEDKALLCTMGTSKIDNLLKQAGHKKSQKGISGTKTSPLLKTLIPIRTNFDDVSNPGHLEMDCVLHCGNNVAGTFADTLNVVDIHTHWNEQYTFLNKTARKTVGAFHILKSRFPFIIKSIDFDNGFEFVNWHLKKYCDNNKIKYTRSRSYKKNDQANIEERNGHRIRKLVGYDRITQEEIVIMLNDIYQNEYRLLNNFFYTTRKLISKEKKGKKYIKKYDEAKTPYQRLLNSEDVDLSDKIKLMAEYKKLNPAELNRNLLKKMSHLKKMISVSKINQATTPPK